MEPLSGRKTNRFIELTCTHVHINYLIQRGWVSQRLWCFLRTSKEVLFKEGTVQAAMDLTKLRYKVLWWDLINILSLFAHINDINLFLQKLSLVIRISSVVIQGPNNYNTEV